MPRRYPVEVRRQVVWFFYYEMKGTRLGPEKFDTGLLFPTGASNPRKIYPVYKGKAPGR